MYKKIKELREDNDLLQSQVAKIINTTQQQYSKIENGKSEISADKLIKLALLYKVSTDYILGLTNEQAPTTQTVVANAKANRTRTKDTGNRKAIARLIRHKKQ